MLLTGDFHTHTKYSDGKTTLLENFRRAKEVGLRAIGCTEHGFSHVFFGLRRKEVPEYQKELRAAERETGVKGFLGLENNLRGISGLCDFTEEECGLFDLYVMGVHVFVHFETRKDKQLGLKSCLKAKFGKKPSASLVKYTTQAYINAIKRNPVDILAHLNFYCFADAVEVAKCCRDYGTYLEISSKKQHLTDEELAAVAETGVRFVINSDAHSTDRIGDTALAEAQIARVGIPLDRIDNIEGRMPAFRLAAWKQKHG